MDGIMVSPFGIATTAGYTTTAPALVLLHFPQCDVKEAQMTVEKSAYVTRK